MSEKTIEISEELFFKVMEVLKNSAMYLSPPEDWKDYKWDDPDDYAAVVYNTFLHMLKDGSIAMGLDYKAENPLPLDTETEKLLQYFENRNNDPS